MLTLDPNHLDPLWKKAFATLLRREAVRVVFVGPDADVDERIQHAKESGKVQPMTPEFFAAIKDFLNLAAEKNRQWSQVIKPNADKAMSDVWVKLWKTPAGRGYQELKAEVDRRKVQVDAIAKRAEDGISRKIIEGGRAVTFLKTTVVAGREDLIEEARQNVERLKHDLAEAKDRLKQLETGKEEILERINVLVVEQLPKPSGPKAAGVPRMWRVRTAAEKVTDAIIQSEEIDGLIADELMAADSLMQNFLAVLEGVAQQQIGEEDLRSLETEEAPSGEPAVYEV